MHKFAATIFRKLKNCFILHHQTWSDNTYLIMEFFWICFVTWISTGQFQAPFVFDNFVCWKGLGLKEKIKLPFLRLFDDPLSKYLTFKRISCMQWLFWVIYQNHRGLGPAFAAHFLHDFSIKIFFIWYSIYEQSFNVIPFFFLKISSKMCYWVLI